MAVSGNSILGLLAAQSMIAQYIHRLLAKRTRDRIIVDRETKKACNCRGIDFRVHDRIATIRGRRE